MVTLQLGQIVVPPGNCLLIKEVSWDDLEAILAELGQHRSTRIAYQQGILELTTPSPEDEHLKELISIAIVDIAETLNQHCESYGTTTWQKQAEQMAVEADNCFYFQTEAIVRDKLTFDLTRDPPPDLALEFGTAYKSLERFPIYGRLGIPEIWCCDQGQLRIHVLQQHQYFEASQSQVFPNLRVQELPELIEGNRDRGRLALRRAIREWVRQQQEI